MIWSGLTEKNIGRRINIIQVLKNGSIGLDPLAKKVGASSKTIRRDLELLEKKYSIKLLRGRQLQWLNASNYGMILEHLLMESDQFCVFQEFLWGGVPADIQTSYQIVRKLNPVLQRLDLWIDYKARCLEGNPTVIFQLRLNYLRDFGSFQTGKELYQAFAGRITEPEIKNLASSWLRLVPDATILTPFLKRLPIAMEIGILCFFDDQTSDLSLRYAFFNTHKTLGTAVFKNTEYIIQELLRLFPIQKESVLQILYFHVFIFLIQLEQKLPIAYINQLREDQPLNADILLVARKVKEQVACLKMYVVNEIALSLELIFLRCYAANLFLGKHSENFISEEFDAYLVDREANHCF